MIFPFATFFLYDMWCFHLLKLHDLGNWLDQVNNTSHALSQLSMSKSKLVSSCRWTWMHMRCNLRVTMQVILDTENSFTKFFAKFPFSVFMFLCLSQALPVALTFNCRISVELALPCNKPVSRVFEGFTVGFHPRSWEIVSTLTNNLIYKWNKTWTMSYLHNGRVSKTY